MTTRRAACQCGRLSVECTGDPVRISVCHCLDCQRRSGSAFAVQARFPADRVSITGTSNEWTRASDDGHGAVFHFCPTCGSTVYYANLPDLEIIAVAVGAFADPNFPAPTVSGYEERRHGWVDITGEGVSHVF